MSAKPHAFVVMPFGSKPGQNGQLVDFNRVYAEYLVPALEAAGLEPFRADQETRAGEIRVDMFQELLVADLVVADLTIDNANVWYELGVRHALRARGIVLVSGGEVTKVFDVYTDRKLRYRMKDGAPDPATLEDDRQKLATMVKDTMESWHGRKVSPVYALLPNLREPDWKSLRIGGVQEFWEKHDTWEKQLELARQGGRIGDLLVLADEGPVAAFRGAAWIKAGEALRKAGRFSFAFEYLERGLAIEHDNLPALQGVGMCLQRLGLAGAPGHSLERARGHYRTVRNLYPKDAETLALLGRVDKDAWTTAWRAPAGKSREKMREDAADEDALLRAAIESYAQAYRADPAKYYAGINALTLMHLYRHLTGDARYVSDSETMVGAVRFAASSEPEERLHFWSHATLGDLEVLIGTPATVDTAYKEAIAKNAQNDRAWFDLDSSRMQLELLRDLGFRPDEVAAGIARFERELKKTRKPEDHVPPRQVLLFSGHVVDAPDRHPARFPADKAPLAAQKIAEELDRLEVNSGDVAFCQAAAGGDLLFIEACQARGVRCQIQLPFPEAEFIERSIMPSAGGDEWRDRFYAVKEKLKSPMRVMPVELGPPPKGTSPFERCNLWLLYTALAIDVDKVRLIALWNGDGGDGPGGTQHMVNEVKRRTGRVSWLDTRKFW